MRTFALALVHHPVKDRQGEIIATSITNLDLHDISRSALTFGATAYFIVHPVEAQRTMTERLTLHWTSGPGGRRVSDRSRAMALISAVSSVEEARLAVQLGVRAELWVTSADAQPGQLEHHEARERLQTPGPPVLLVLGTGWGLADSVLGQADVRVAPVLGRGEAGYNHLSVRAAAAILLDRLTLGTEVSP